MTRWGDLCECRPMSTRERALVIDSWLLSWSAFARPPMTHEQARPVVEDYLKRCDLVNVAVVPGVERAVVGWVARLEPGVLCYLYVLKDYRRRGIAERLLASVGIEARGPRWRWTFWTPRLRLLCNPDPKRPTRIPWNGVSNERESRASRRTRRRSF